MRLISTFSKHKILRKFLWFRLNKSCRDALKNLAVIDLDGASVEAATKLLQRGMRLTAMIQDGECQLMSDESNVAFRPTIKMQPA